jgi:hypothetical protein
LQHAEEGPEAATQESCKEQEQQNWQGSRHNDMKAVNQVFRTNKAEIKQKTLEALRLLLRQTNHALDEIRKYLGSCTEYV